MFRVPAPACAVIRAVAGIVGHRVALRLDVETFEALRAHRQQLIDPATRKITEPTSAESGRDRACLVGLASSPLADAWAVEMTTAAAEPTKAHRGLTMTE